MTKDEKLRRLRELRQRVESECGRGGRIDVDVWVWPMGSGDLGHAALRIDRVVFGYYPSDLDGEGAYTTTALSSSPGDPRVDTLEEAGTIFKDQQVVEFGLAVPCENVPQTIDFLIGVVEEPGTYELLSRNCTTVVRDALAAGSVDDFVVETPITEFRPLLHPAGTAVVRAHSLGGLTIGAPKEWLVGPTALADYLKHKLGQDGSYVERVAEEVF